MDFSNVCLILLEDKGVLLEDIDDVVEEDTGFLEDDKGVLVAEIGVLEETGVLIELVLEAIIFKTGVFGVLVFEADGFLTLGIVTIFFTFTVSAS